MKFFITSKDIGIDLGTSNTLLYVKGQGVLLREPSVVTINSKNRQVLAAGLEARNMIGRTPEGIETVRPLKDGVIANFDLTEQMLKKFIEKVNIKGTFKRPRITVSHPSGITEVEKRAINDAISQLGVSKVVLIEEPVAAAIGSGLPVDEPVGSMIVDIGGGTTEIAVISLQGIVTSKTLRIAGDELDETIIDYVKREFNLMIGERTAEKVKIDIGSVYEDKEEEEKDMEIRGRDLMTGLPKAVTITESQVREALVEPIALVIEAIKATIEQTPPELAADIMDKGIMLSGGGALIKGLDKLIYNQIHIPAYVSENPLECVVLGAGKCLEVIDKI
ncbi:rod shape-determining protein [Clostridium magnum]|uniref:Cell shape-determining protein MreB n=1 Tax=Clostridium magnum DSM 2767 TaxID=1121326 RepID=A0A161WXG6_9CLOT|nr:rod shape-determining protein [Clostridium magnum]KZL91668.1 Rod shape-determining protein MreB [Clostridium magnum DSM 2767]SHH51706.1 rod shape-determining protein MreB [Clostridium magnum DSM 2767]